MSISSILSSSTSCNVSSVAERLGVPAQDPCAARAEGAGSGGVDPGLVLFEASLEESVTLVPGRAALAAAGLQVAAVARQQKSVRVLEVADLELEHPHGAHGLARETEGETGGRMGRKDRPRLICEVSNSVSNKGIFFFIVLLKV